MINAIAEILVIRAGYGKKAAQVTAKQLYALKHRDLKQAVAGWLRTGAEAPVGEAPYDTASLMKNHALTYPAAILFVNWYRDDPKTAAGSMTHWGGG